MKYKALICDVDGTLVPNREDGMPSEKVKEAIAKAKKKICIGLATARPYTSIKPILDVLQLSCPSIILGGAQIYMPKEKKIRSEKFLLPNQIREIWKIARENMMQLRISHNDTDVRMNETHLNKKNYDIYTEAISLEEAEIFTQKISSIPHIGIHKAAAWIDEGIEKVHVIISHPEATKQHGILEVAEILGISTHEIIGIGEGYNDFPLLMACGLKIAMGNAVEDVKAIADYIVPTVAEDGVAEVIERFVLSKN